MPGRSTAWRAARAPGVRPAAPGQRRHLTKTGHALIGARQWIPREQIADPVTSLVTGLPLDLEFRAKGQLAMDTCADCYADGLHFDFACRDEVHGSCTKAARADAVSRLLKDKRRWEVRSAGQGSRGGRWYARAWIATASPRHQLLVRRHLKTGELAFHYCYGPAGQLLTKTRLIRAAGLRWPAEEDFELGKDCPGLDQCQARPYTAIQRHTVLAFWCDRFLLLSDLAVAGLLSRARIRRPWCRRYARAAGRRGHCAARTPRSCGP